MSEKKLGEGLKVIGAGFGRTGTESLQLALQKLGFDPCYHMKDVLFVKSHHVYIWKNITVNKQLPADWDVIFKGYKAAVDFPAAFYYKELMQAYPDAKVILSVRSSSEEWWKSFSATILDTFRNPGITIFLQWIPFLAPWSKSFRPMVLAMLKNVFHASVHELTKEQAIKVYSDWITEVQATVPKDKLLVFNVKEGWQPLCDFLGVPVPNEPFPRVNDTKTFRFRVKMMRIITTIPLLLGIAVIIGAIYYGRRYY